MTLTRTRHHCAITRNTEASLDPFAAGVTYKLSLISLLLLVFCAAIRFWPVPTDNDSFARFSITFAHKWLVAVGVGFICRHFIISYLKESMFQDSPLLFVFENCGVFFIFLPWPTFWKVGHLLSCIFWKSSQSSAALRRIWRPLRNAWLLSMRANKNQLFPHQKVKFACD